LTAYTVNDEAQEFTEGSIYVFRADGTATYYAEGQVSQFFEWSTEGDSLTISTPFGSVTGTFVVTSTTLTFEFDNDDGHAVETFTKREDDYWVDKEHDPDLIRKWNMISLTVDGVDAGYENTYFRYDVDGTGTYRSGDYLGTFQWSTAGNELSITEFGTTVYTYSVTSTTMIREIDAEGQHWVETFEKVEADLPVEGTWDLTDYSVNGTSIPSEELFTWTYVFNNEGTGTFTVDGVTEEISWSTYRYLITIDRLDLSKTMMLGYGIAHSGDSAVITGLMFLYIEEENLVVETYTARSSNPHSPPTVHGVVRDALHK
jgi:hypothetical protein